MSGQEIRKLIVTDRSDVALGLKKLDCQSFDGFDSYGSTPGSHPKDRSYERALFGG